MTPTFGRTNRAFAPIWLRLQVPSDPQECWLFDLAGAAVDSGAPIDISTNPGLWGGPLRGTEATLVTVGGAELEHATDEKHAADLLDAHLIQTLSCIGREWIDFYFLHVTAPWEKYQISGALMSLESAKQEGHVRYLGLFADGARYTTQGLWERHDAFDAVMVEHKFDDRIYRLLTPLAAERRVGMVTRHRSGWSQRTLKRIATEHPVLATVSTPDEIKEAVESPNLPEDEKGGDDGDLLYLICRGREDWSSSGT